MPSGQLLQCNWSQGLKWYHPDLVAFSSLCFSILRQFVFSQRHQLRNHSEKHPWEFPGGPVAKTVCPQCRGGAVSIFGQGTRSHMPQYTPQLKNPCAASRTQCSQIKKYTKKTWCDEAEARPAGRELLSHPSDKYLVLMLLQEPLGGTGRKGSAAGVELRPSRWLPPPFLLCLNPVTLHFYPIHSFPSPDLQPPWKTVWQFL